MFWIGSHASRAAVRRGGPSASSPGLRRYDYRITDNPGVSGREHANHPEPNPPDQDQPPSPPSCADPVIPAPPAPQAQTTTHPQGSELQLDWAFRIADLCGVDLLVTDPHSARFLDCNRSASERLGYSHAELLELGPAGIQADPEHDAIWVAQRLQELFEQGGGHFPTRHRHRDGTVLDVKVNHIIASLEGRAVVVSVVQDCTQQRSVELALAEQLRLFSQGEAIHGTASWSHCLATGAMQWTPGMDSIAGERPAAFNTYLNLVHPEDREQWRRNYHLSVQRLERFELPHRLLLPSGEVRAVQLNGQPCSDLHGNPSQVLGTLCDTTARHDLQLQIEHNQYRDQLTELPNKQATINWLSRQLSGRSHNVNLAIFSIDIDGFQEINDSFGIETGNQLLQALAELLSTQLAEGAWVARQGSDEFVVIQHRGVNSFGEAIKRGRDLQRRIHAIDNLRADLPLRPTVSLGLSCFPEHGDTALGLLQCANTALMEAKRQGRGQLRAYSTTISRQIRERLVLDGALHKAITREQLRLLVQPQSDRSGQLCGGEVLLRWHDHYGKTISPSFFIPLAEQSGLIFPLSEWVLHNCLSQISRWRRHQLQVPRLGLNISTRLLESIDRHLPEQLQSGLERHGLTADALELEITETALLRNPVAAAETVRLLASAGFRIAIDDFGTGYSSMDLLRTLPVHKIKIDTTFIRNLCESPEDRAIVQATITLAHGLGMSCVAEGVETEEQLAILHDLNCDQFQGYLCGRPIDVDQFGQLLLDSQLPCGARRNQPDQPPTGAVRQGSGPENNRASSFDELKALRSSIDNSLDAYLLLEAITSSNGEILDFTILESNRTASDYMQQKREALVGQTICTLFPRVTSNGLLSLYASCLHQQSPLEIDDFLYPDHELFGDTRSYDLRLYPRRNLLTVNWRDVTSRSQRYRSLSQAADLLKLLEHHLVDTIVLFDQDERVTWISASLQAMTGWKPEQWLGQPFHNLFAQGNTAPKPLHLADWLPYAGVGQSRRLRLATPRGGWGWVDVSGRRLPASPGGDPGQHQGYALSLRAADEEELREQRLLQLSSHDPLTNLLNRSAVLQQLQDRLGNGRDRAEAIALICINCNNLKAINRNHGHAAGDAVLQALAQRILAGIRPADRAARLGSSAFLVVLEGLQQDGEAERMAHRLFETLTPPVVWQAHELPLTLSIGLAQHAAGDDVPLLLQRAEHALEQAQNGDGRHGQCAC